MRRRIFPEGSQELRWSRFKELGEAASMFKVVGERVFPFLRELGGEESAYATHMRDARFTIPTPGLLTKVVELLDAVPMEDRDTKGDIYEYMLGKLATAGTNGQFRTPRHIIELMVAMTEPTPRDVMVDPACGTCGFPVAVIVPDGVLFGSSKAHKELRRTLVEDHFFEGVVSLPSGVFRPYAGVSTAILFFTKTGRGGTDNVWFYDMTADGWSLDDKRNPLLPL